MSYLSRRPVPAFLRGPSTPVTDRGRRPGGTAGAEALPCPAFAVGSARSHSETLSSLTTSRHLSFFSTFFCDKFSLYFERESVGDKLGPKSKQKTKTLVLPPRLWMSSGPHVSDPISRGSWPWGRPSLRSPVLTPTRPPRGPGASRCHGHLGLADRKLLFDTGPSVPWPPRGELRAGTCHSVPSRGQKGRTASPVPHEPLTGRLRKGILG